MQWSWLPILGCSLFRRRQEGWGTSSTFKPQQICHSLQFQGDNLWVLRSCRKTNFLFSISLKDAYFQISIHLDSQSYFHIVLNRRVYQCFGLSTAPPCPHQFFSGVRLGSQERVTVSLLLGQLASHSRSDYLLVKIPQAPFLPQQRPEDSHDAISWEKLNLMPASKTQHLRLLIDTLQERVYWQTLELPGFRMWQTISFCSFFALQRCGSKSWAKWLHWINLFLEAESRCTLFSVSWVALVTNDTATPVPSSEECLLYINWWLQKER